MQKNVQNVSLLSLLSQIVYMVNADTSAFILLTMKLFISDYDLSQKLALYQI